MTFVNFLIGLPAMLLCLIVQTAVAFWCVRYYVRLSPQVGSGQGFLAGIRPLIVATLVLLVGNLVQIMLWGALFLWLGEFEQAYDAIYHSAVNFSSLGYGDIVMSRERRLLGPLEAVNGVLMLGMSAATLMAIVQHMIKLREARPNEGLGGRLRTARPTVVAAGDAVPDWRACAARAWLLGVLTWFPSPPGAQGIVEARK